MQHLTNHIAQRYAGFATILHHVMMTWLLVATLAILFPAVEAIGAPKSSYPAEYGLNIRSYPSPKDEYTGFALADAHPISTHGKPLTLEFQDMVREANVFGCVFRIITHTGANIDMLFTVGDGNRRFPVIVTGDTVYPLSKEARRNVWVDAKITIDPRSGNFTAIYDGQKIEGNYPELKGANSVRITFGLCPIPEYTLLDVASVNVRDIKVTSDNKPIYHWRLGYHNGRVCYDEISHAPITVDNPEWIIDQHLSWKKIYSAHFDTYPSVAFDERMATFYFASDSKNLMYLNAPERYADTIRITKGEFAANFPNQMIFLPDSHKLLSYNLDENLFSVYDNASQQWKSDTKPTAEHDYWNNTVVYNPADSTLISFGGYGHYHYNNRLLISYPHTGAPQRAFNLTDIHPRYSMASALVDSTLYIFGGRGCPSGRQELSPRNYYDLYAVNLLTKQVNKLWEGPLGEYEGDFAPGSNMVYDRASKCFYVLVTQKGGRLIRISPQKAGYEVMSLPIHIDAYEQEIYLNLYLSPQQKKLYALKVGSKAGGESTLDIYELNYPPLSVNAFQQPEQNKSQSTLAWILWIGGALLAIAAAAATFIWRRRKNSRISSAAAVTSDAMPDNPAGPTAGNNKITLDGPISSSSTDKEFNHYDLERSAVRFFGGFQVFDAAGNDISSMFTPTLRSLFVLLILYTGRNDKGISGHKLIQLMWYNKSEEAGKNLRNVYLSKLRNTLERVGDVKIVNKNGYWTVAFGDGTVCDYLEAVTIFNNNDNTHLEELLELLLKGNMLPNMENDWIDTFKTDFSDRTIDLLTRLVKNTDLDDNLRLRIADTLFQHDYINEDALTTKLQILTAQGKKGLAKTVYDAFCKNYQSSYGSPYETSLIDVINTAE